MGTVQYRVLSTSCNDRKPLIGAASAHRYVVKMDRCRVASSGILNGKSILSIENVGLALWVLEFNLNLTVVLIMK